MNRLSTERRARILNLLVEGVSMRSVTRLETVGINTVARLILAAGDAAQAHHDKVVRDIAGRRCIECDEAWSFVYAKNRNVRYAVAPPRGAGDVWTWSAIDADSKLVVSYLVGLRGEAWALEFMDDLRSRLEDRPQITTDGHAPYVRAVEGAFGGDVDFAQILKQYETAWTMNDGYWEATTQVRSDKKIVEGNPEWHRISTSYIERSNLTMRMCNRRFARRTNAFSKRLEKHSAMVALFFLYYNFCRKHRSLGITPAVAAGVDTEQHDLAWIIGLMDARAPKPNRPKTYRRRVA
ncbi:MAG: IS1 family transposase [Gammaproteobacteria bacterium]|nr:IS1 family transposase [Gammaproteobacteria bacterium]